MKQKTIVGIALAIVITIIGLQYFCFRKQEAIVIESPPQALVKQQGEVYHEGLRVDKTQCIYYAPISSEPIVLKDNPEAQNATLHDLTIFLVQTRPKRDALSENLEYNFYSGKPYYTCGYYTEEMHNDAETQGIKAGIALLKMANGSFHGINVFETIDRGLVYIDGAYYSDKMFYSIATGQKYEVYGSHHTIEEVVIIWEGYTAR